MTTSGRQAFYDWWEQQQGKCLIFQRNSWNTAWWMLTFLQRCCAQFKKNTQSLEHVNLFQEAIPFASAASLAQRRSFMPHESISIILKMGYDPARQFSMKPCRWLSLMSRNGSHSTCPKRRLNADWALHVGRIQSRDQHHIQIIRLPFLSSWTSDRNSPSLSRPYLRCLVRRDIKTRTPFKGTEIRDGDSLGTRLCTNSKFSRSV